MIAFGCSIVMPEVYRRCAEPGIKLAREPDSEVFACQAAGTIFRSYNLILDQAAGCEDLEALVIVHEDAEILDADFCQALRQALRDPEVAVVGCVGAAGVRSIAWWEGTTVGSFVHRYGELGGGEILAPANGGMAAHRGTGDVDMIDGFMMALSPWAVRTIRFDESLGPHWGYDFDYCQQVRAAKRRVLATDDLRVAHNHSLQLVRDAEAWSAAYMRATEKWDTRLRNGETTEADWKLRARRAEAEAVVGRLQGAWKLMQANARSDAHARRMARVTDTRSWRLTAPLRRVNAIRRARTGAGRV